MVEKGLELPNLVDGKNSDQERAHWDPYWLLEPLAKCWENQRCWVLLDAWSRSNVRHAEQNYLLTGLSNSTGLFKNSDISDNGVSPLLRVWHWAKGHACPVHLERRAAQGRQQGRRRRRLRLGRHVWAPQQADLGVPPFPVNSLCHPVPVTGQSSPGRDLAEYQNPGSARLPELDVQVPWRQRQRQQQWGPEYSRVQRHDEDDLELQGLAHDADDDRFSINSDDNDMESGATARSVNKQESQPSQAPL